MSALRVSRPGKPVQFIDLGPAVGRIIHSRGPVYGSVAVAGSPLAKPTIPGTGRTETRSGLREVPERCGYLMPKNGEHCARRVGHATNDHRSERNMEAIRRRRWAEM